MSNQGRTLKIAVIGIGRMGRRHSLNVAFASPRSELVAVCDHEASSQKWAQENLPAATKFFSSYQECFAKGQIDAVIISTETSLHSIIACAALASGLHVLLEKPISTDLEGAKPVILAAKKYNKQKIMVALSRRFDASYRDAYERIQNNELGEPYLVSSATCDKYDDSGFFVAYSKSSGGCFIDMGIHDIDCARFLLRIGKKGLTKQVERVFATGITTKHPELAALGDADNALCIVEFVGGKLATFHLSRTAMHGHDCFAEVHGSEGKLSINRNPRMNRVEIFDQTGVRAVSTQTYYDRFEEAFRTEIREFTACILDDTPLPVTLDDAVEAAKIAIGLTWCFRSGKTVYFNEEGNPIPPVVDSGIHL